jgi:hypothetical protein
MSEFLIVVAIYMAVSFAGMAVLWTVAAQKGFVQAPKFFFWIRRGEQRPSQEDIDFFRNRPELAEQLILARSLFLNLHSPSGRFHHDAGDQDISQNQIAESAVLTSSR